MRKRRHQAFTLLEMIGIILVLAVAVPPTLFAVREASIDRASPVLISRARWLATAKLEDIIADRHSTTRGYAYLATANYPAENPIAGYPDFTRAVTFTETQADLVTPGAGCMTVTITITWPDPKHGTRSLAISTVLTDYSAS
ncbi:MAG: type II secretion system protein [Phycisphaerales bacterium]|nr:type II secretion system protein [Phycisphaerales bacterium]